MEARKLQPNKWIVGAVGVVFLFLLLFNGVVVWIIIRKPVSGTEGLISQVLMITAFIQALIAAVLATTVLYQAQTNAGTLRLMEHQQSDAARIRRRDLAQAMVTATVEAGTRCAELAALQQRGLKKIVTSQLHENLTIASHARASASIASVSRSLTEVRFHAPDIQEIAERLFDLSIDCYDAALKGEVARVGQNALSIHELSKELRS